MKKEKERIEKRERGEDPVLKGDDPSECTPSPDVPRREWKGKKSHKSVSKIGSQDKSKDFEEAAGKGAVPGSQGTVPGSQGEGTLSGRLLAAPPIVRRGSNKSTRNGSGSDTSPMATPAHLVTNATGGGSFVYYDDLSLLAPVSETWLKHGYLMLRMKLPNNRYAWTYMVSDMPGPILYGMWAGPIL